MLKFAHLPFKEIQINLADSQNRAELLLLAPSTLVPKLQHQGYEIWDVIAIGEYLNETFPQAHLLPTNLKQRAYCRSICGEMHAGFQSLRSALPMNLKAQYQTIKVWSKAQQDINRIAEIWADCLQRYKGPFLFGSQRSLADAMYTPVVCRLNTYGLILNGNLFHEAIQRYCQTILTMPELREWTHGALNEVEEIEELEMEF